MTLKLEEALGTQLFPIHISPFGGRLYLTYLNEVVFKKNFSSFGRTFISKGNLCK
jgi:hypothetical protein